MNIALKILFWLFAAAYVFALVIFLIGHFGLFGAERDPLAGVFLMPLGLPWNRLLDVLGEAALPWVGLLSPLINVIIIWLIRLFWR